MWEGPNRKRAGTAMANLYTPAYQPAGDEVAVFETSKGTIRARLDAAGAPIHVANFCELAEKGYCIKAEYRTNPNNKHEDGALAMARSMAPDSAGSQFYFCLGAQHFLDPNYTVFGQTVEGLDVVKQLRVGDEIVRVTIEHAAE